MIINAFTGCLLPGFLSEDSVVEWKELCHNVTPTSYLVPRSLSFFICKLGVVIPVLLFVRIKHIQKTNPVPGT